MNRTHYTPFERDGMWFFTTPTGGTSAGFVKEQAAISAARHCRQQDNISGALDTIVRLRRGNPRNH